MRVERESRKRVKTKLLCRNSIRERERELKPRYCKRVLRFVRREDFVCIDEELKTELRCGVHAYCCGWLTGCTTRLGYVWIDFSTPKYTNTHSHGASSTTTTFARLLPPFTFATTC